TIRCGWHSWSFDLQGKLLGAPHLADRGGEVPSEGGSPPSLKPVRTAEWMGTVFVNLDGSAHELHEQTRALYHHYKEWEGLDGLRPIATVEQTWEAHWKLRVEGGIEDYP